MPELTAMAKTKRTVDFAGIDVPSVAAQLMTVREPFALSIVVEARGRRPPVSVPKPSSTVKATRFAGVSAEGASTIAHASIKSLETETPQIVDVDLDVDRLRTCIGSKS